MTNEYRQYLRHEVSKRQKRRLQLDEALQRAIRSAYGRRLRRRQLNPNTRTYKQFQVEVDHG